MDSPILEQNNQQIVHCGNLSAKVTSAELISVFCTVAPVLNISLRKKSDKLTAYAFVTFMSGKDAEKIVEQFNFYTLHNKQMILSIYSKGEQYPPEANVFVKNLPVKLKSKDLYDIFKMFGSIVSCKVATNENGESKGFGFIQYSSVKAAKTAISNCQNAKIGSNILEVMTYNKPAKDSKISSEPVPFTNVYMKNFPVVATERDLRNILEKFGPISSLYIPLGTNGEPLGYACANYEVPEDAAMAVEKLNNQVLFNVEGQEFLPPFYIQKAEKKKDRLECLKKMMSEISINKEVTTKNNLYISNIPEGYTVEELTSLFEPFGTIKSCKLNKTTVGHQYGYVCFLSAEEAAKAHDQIDKLVVGGKNLVVTFYKNKHERQNETDTPKTSVLNQPEGKGSNSARSNFLQSILYTVERSAPLYKQHWDNLGVKSSVEFTKIISKDLSLIKEKEMKKIFASPTLLESEIRKIISNKETKTTEN